MIRARLFVGVANTERPPNQPGRAERVAALADRASRRADLWAPGLPPMGEAVGMPLPIKGAAA